MKKKKAVRRGESLIRDFRGLEHFGRKNPWRVVSLIIVLIFSLFLPGTNFLETLQLQYQPPLVRASEFDDFQPAAYPKRTYDEPMPYVTAEAVEVLDVNSGVPMVEVNPNERLWPASITKLMTALVALDYYSPEQIVTVRRLVPASEESEMGLAVGDRLTVQSLIYGLLVPSGNDAAYTLADNYPGGIENFIYSMNERAKILHMESTHFANPSGLDQAEHFTTAKDISLLTMEALKNSLISRAVATSGITLGDASGKRSYTIKNVNQLLGYVYGVDGVKTGFTDFAGQCLVSSVSRDGHRVVVVLLKSQDRFGESSKIISWVFRNFQWIPPQIP